MGRHWRKFIGSLEIPVYNKLTQYNFYDTLDSLLKRMFSQKYHDDFLERKNRIDHTTNADELLKHDIEPGCPEHLAMNEIDFELVLEKNSDDFKTVLNQLEQKEEEKIMVLEKMLNIRSKQE